MLQQFGRWTRVISSAVGVAGGVFRSGSRRVDRARTPLAVAVVLAVTLVAVAGSTTGRSAEVLQVESAAVARSTTPSPIASPVATAVLDPSPSPTGPTTPAETSTGLRVDGGPAGTAQLTGSPGVALTFDDGPDPVNTPRLLDLLKQEGVKATFCLVGFRARDHPDIVRRIAGEGHTLCNHSWNHNIRLARSDAAAIRSDLEATNGVIRNAVPDAQIKYFRAPGGNFDTRMVGVALALGMASLYWHVDTRDWDSTSDASDHAHIGRVVAVVKNRTRPGSIVLAHDNGQPNTVIAFQQLLPWLKAHFTLIGMPT